MSGQELKALRVTKSFQNLQNYNDKADLSNVLMPPSIKQRMDNDLQSEQKIQKLLYQIDQQKQIEKNKLSLEDTKSSENVNKVKFKTSIQNKSTQNQSSSSVTQLEIQSQKDNQELTELLKNRCDHLVKIVSSLELVKINKIDYNFLHFFTDIVQDLTMNLENTTKSEIQVNQLRKEIGRLFVQRNKDQFVMNSQSQRQKYLETKIDDIQTLYESIKEQNEVQAKQILKLKNQNQGNKIIDKLKELTQQLKTVNDRLDIYRLKNSEQNPYQINQTFTNLIKENDSLKRDIMNKQSQIDRCQEIISRLKIKNHSLTNKIDALSKNNYGKSKKQDSQEDEIIHLKDISIQYFETNQIPNNLDYRFNHLKAELIYMLQDIVQYGAPYTSVYLQNIGTYDEKQDVIQCVSKQFISFKNLADKNNQFMQAIIKMVTFDEISDVMIYLDRNISSILKCDITNFWSIDSLTGLLSTYDRQGIQHKAYSNGGIFFDAIQGQNVINCIKQTKVFLYNSADSKEKDKRIRDNVIIIPIVNKNHRVIGLLELSNIKQDDFGQDEMYLVTMISRLLNALQVNIHNKNKVKQQLKVKEKLNQSISAMIFSKTKYQFVQAVQYQSQIIFGVSSTKFLFYENKKIVQYFKDSIKQYDLDQSITGTIIKNQNCQIVTDVLKSRFFSREIDTHSLLPIFFCPVMIKKDEQQLKNSVDEDQFNPYLVVGVLQLVLKNRGCLTNVCQDDDNKNESGCEKIDFLAQNFCQSVADAYMLVKDKLTN